MVHSLSTNEFINWLDGFHTSYYEELDAYVDDTYIYLSENKQILSDYVEFGTNNQEAIKNRKDECARQAAVLDKYGNKSTEQQKEAYNNIEVLFKTNVCEYIDQYETDGIWYLIGNSNAAKLLTPEFIMRYLDPLSKHLDVGEVVANLDLESMSREELDELFRKGGRINQLRDLGVHENDLKKIEHALKTAEEKEQEKVKQHKIEEKLDKDPGSLTVDEILDNYEFLKSKGFSITPRELIEKERRSKIPQ